MSPEESGLTEQQQGSFEFPDYIVREVDGVTKDTVKAGDIVYFKTTSESSYIFEVEGYEWGFLTGSISRRGDEARLSETCSIAVLDYVPAKVYVDYGSLNNRYNGALVALNDSEAFRTSRVTNLQVINFNPYTA